MEWLGGLIGAILGSGLTGFLALYLDKQRGRREAIGAREQREYDRIESRYQDRLSAYADLEAAVDVELRAYETYIERNHGMTPSETGYDEVELKTLNDALVRVRLLGSRSLASAADELVAAVHKFVWDYPDAQQQLEGARDAFRDAARTDLHGGAARREITPYPPGYDR